MAKNKTKFKKKPKTKMSESNKKIKRPQIKLYAKRLYDMEKELKAGNKEVKYTIQELVDEICRCYEPDAMYLIDEEVYKLASKESLILTN